MKLPNASLTRLLHWGIAAVWVSTAVAVLIATHIHPPTTLAASLDVRRISFKTDANRILGPNNDSQLLVSKIRSVQIHFNSPQLVSADGTTHKTDIVEISGEPFAACSFYRVRSDGVNLERDSLLTLSVDQDPNPTSSTFRPFSLNVHGLLSGNLTSQAATQALVPGFSCQHVRVDGASVQSVESRLSPGGGDAIFFATYTDARLDFALDQGNSIGDTQIPIRDAIRFWEVEPGSENVKTVLLGNENKVSFEDVGQSFMLDDADLLLVEPHRDLYLRRFVLKDGIQLSLHGAVREVKSGAGPKDLRTHLPTLFDRIDNTKRVWGVIPALVAFVLGLFEKLRRSPGEK